MFRDVFKGRRVLVTGHTGFKGAWLTRWLLELGADVTGLALAPDTTPNLFSLLEIKKHICHCEIDVRDAPGVRRVLSDSKPEIVFHLAAQALVRRSYIEPKTTWDVNVGGMVNVLEAIRQIGSVNACVVVTSDKCYENREQVWGYRECDPMGGHDPYSSSKGATELAVASWRNSFFHNHTDTRIATARAGNVIGGGDWSVDRIVVDLVRAITAAYPIVLRNPVAIRPWQHVLEPLSGYLTLAEHLVRDNGHGEADSWNFGPADDSLVTVETLAKAIVATWGEGEIRICQVPGQPHEAGLLKLDCSKTRARLGWHGVWDFDRTVQHTVGWYRALYQGEDAEKLTREEISSYVTCATQAQLPWAN